MKSVYITADRLTMETGGGAVTTNELAALKSVSEDVFVLSRDDIDPTLFKQPDSPFLFDYFALQQILLQQEIQRKYFDFAHLYSGCFTETVRYLKDRGAKISYTIAAHDRALSIEEFQRLGLEYPYHHVTDDRLWSIYTEGYRLADIVIAPSRRSAQILESMGCKNVRVIPHGIVWPKKVKPIPENFDCLYLGATGPDKGVLYLIQAWGMLNYPNSRLILAGPGTESLESFIRQVTNRGNFVLTGRVPDVADVYNACSAYVQPSVTEGYGLEIPEAMSFGRPVIASEGAGASELLNEDCGFIVPIRNAKYIAEHIDWLKNNRDSMISMGEKGRIIARKYTWGVIRKRYARIFSELGG